MSKVLCADGRGYSPGRMAMKWRDITLERSSSKSVFVGRIVGRETGFNHATLCSNLYHIPPGGATVIHRHDETILHVLTGRGNSLIDEVRYDWEPGDTIHIKPGAWHQHNVESEEAANMLAVKATPLLNYLKPSSIEERGDGVAPVDDSYVPDHPFGLGRQEIISPTDEKWKDSWAVFEPEREDAWVRRMKASKTIMKGKDVRWEVGGHKGEFNARILDSGMGFDSRIIDVGLQSIPPGGQNETHKHDEAMVFILSGHGFVVVDGEKIEVERGDCVFVHFGRWHQFCNASQTEPFIQLRFINAVLKQYLFPFPWTETAEDTVSFGVDPAYVPSLPW